MEETAEGWPGGYVAETAGNDEREIECNTQGQSRLHGYIPDPGLGPSFPMHAEMAEHILGALHWCIFKPRLSLKY